MLDFLREGMVTSRCQRCGRGCAGPLCPACEGTATVLQRLMKAYPDASRQPGPPAVVVQTFEAVGSLQLHRLSKRARFYCVTCRERKRGVLVATTNGDWKKAVCNICYGALVKKQQGKAKKKAPKQTRQPSKTVRHKQLNRRDGSSAGQATAKGQNKQPTRRRPSGIDSLLEFFRAAGVDAQLGPTGHLWIDGRRIEPLAQVPSPETAEWINVVNEVALKYVRDKFIRTVEDNARFVADLGASLLPLPKGVAIMRGDEQLGVIRPAHASIPHHWLIYKNFLTTGPHWQKVANVLHDAEAKRAAASKHEQGKRIGRPRKRRRLPPPLGEEERREEARRKEERRAEARRKEERRKEARRAKARRKEALKRIAVLRAADPNYPRTEKPPLKVPPPEPLPLPYLVLENPS